MSPLVVAYGGGVNSNALLEEMRKRGIVPDLILNADTGGENPKTYAGIKWMQDWCERNGFPPIIVVQKTYQGRPETLEANCLRMNMLPSIAYGFKSCSMKFKIDPQDKFCNSWEPALAAWKQGKKVTKIIGYDAGEQRRASIKSSDKYDYWYPLIEWGIWREHCEAICVQAGLPATKSSCFFCPSMRKPEILELNQSHPELMARALEMEKNAKLTTVKGLGRNFAWGDFIRADTAQMKMFEDHSAPELPCGCYDG